MSDRYEAHKLHYLTRAAEVLGISDPKAEAKYALGHQRNWQTLHPVARYIAEHEPPPDPNEALRGLVEEEVYKHWSKGPGRVINVCLALIDRMRADGLLKEGV